MEKEKQLKKEDWRLYKIELSLGTFGKDKGKYTGTVRFGNGEFESFSFKIRQDMAGKYIALISEDLVKGADNLANSLMESLKKQGLL